MKIDIKVLREFINISYKGDYKKFAEALKLDSVTVWRVLKNKGNAGEKFITSLMLYCKTHGLEYDYFFTDTVA